MSKDSKKDTGRGKEVRKGGKTNPVPPPATDGKKPQKPGKKQ